MTTTAYGNLKKGDTYLVYGGMAHFKVVSEPTDIPPDAGYPWHSVTFKVVKVVDGWAKPIPADEQTEVSRVTTEPYRQVGLIATGEAADAAERKG